MTVPQDVPGTHPIGWPEPVDAHTPPPTVRFLSLPLPASGSAVAAVATRVPATGSGVPESSLVSGYVRASAPPTMPHPGETFLGFRLVEELGRGSFARVFLAKQDSLAGREVAVKVTLRPTREADRLARLQHTNVVPVYSVHDAAPVQLICMPYLGRRTIADLLQSRRRSQKSPGLSTRNGTRARRASATVAGSRPGSHGSTPGVQPAAAAPRTADAPGGELIGDVGAVLRTLAQLADGLAHAHARGILHLDLKPANVLLADTGEPMLLDFNLSFDAAEVCRELVGGTVPYMAPEQILDMRTHGNGNVDARTDLYALGVMTFEMLTGAHPFPATSKTLADFDGLVAARRRGPPPVRPLNLDVTPAVEAIVRKLLAPEPSDRYQTAADLRDDVRRQLADRPLKFAADRSVRERVVKWRRRNPRVLVGMVVAVVLALAGGAGAVAHQASEAQADAVAETQARRLRDALDATRLDLILPNDSASRARGMAKAEELLAGYGLPNDPEWRRKPAFHRIAPNERPAVAADLGELLLLLGHARWEQVRHAPDDAGRRAVATDALQYNQIAEGCFVGSPAPAFVARQRSELGGEAAAALPPTPPATARDYFLDAVSHSAVGRYATATPLFGRAVAAQPNHAAAQFLLANCLHQTGQHQRAVERYDVARALLPTDMRPSFQRGLVFLILEKYAAADDEFTAAINLAPALGELYRTRATVRQRLGRLADAERDLSAALSRGASPVRVLTTRAELRQALGDPVGAAADRDTVAEYRPVDANDFLIRGQSRTATDPTAALADFKAALEMNPRSRRAALRQAGVLAEQLGDPVAALTVATRATILFPEDAPIRVAKAVLLARLGRRDEAHREAALARELSDDLDVTYHRACVFALTSKSHPADASVALSLLRQAYRDGYRDKSRYAADHDIDPIRSLPEFEVFLGAVAELSR